MFLTARAGAHPVPRAEYDRNVTIEWKADGVHVLYRVEIDQFTLLTTVGNPANGFPIDPKKQIGPKQVGDAYIARMRQVVPDAMVGTIDGKPVTFTCTDARVNFADSAQFRFWLKAPHALSPGRHTIEVQDLNFLDKPGRLAMKFDAGAGIKAEKISEPPEGRLTETSESEKRTVSATVFATGTAPPPKDDAPSRAEAAPPETAPTGFWDLFRKVREDEDLAVLLDSPVGLWVVLLIAAMHGVLHSVAPGHGKTMVAAYLIGEQGTPRHAIILGLIVTLTHTSAAFAVALLLKFVLQDTPPRTVQSVLGLGGGALVTFIGFWLLMQRLGGRSDHFHVGADSHGHAHAHGDGHGHSHGEDGGHGHSHGVTPEQFARVGWLRLVLLGISGGVIPCWGAILWVLYCVTAGRYGLAVWAVLAFSVGLASVLILIGLSVVWSGRLGASAFGGRGWFRVVSKWLPVVGAALVIAIGLWLCRINLPK